MSWSPTVLNQTPATTETIFDEVRAGGHTAGALELVLNISVDPAVEAAFDAAIKSVQCYLLTEPVAIDDDAGDTEAADRERLCEPVAKTRRRGRFNVSCVNGQPHEGTP